jgi:hypothetical protein
MAPLQDPPRPILDYAEIASYSLLGDFELLRHSRGEILKKPWSVPANREVAAKYFKIKGAQMELRRLHVEIRRLEVSMYDEEELLSSSSQRLETTDPHVSAEIRNLYDERRRVNNTHRKRLSAIYTLDGYSGPGPYIHPNATSGDIGMDFKDGDDGEDEEVLVDEDDTLCDDVDRLDDYMDRLS